MYKLIIKWVENLISYVWGFYNLTLTSQSDHLPLSHPNTSEIAHFDLSYLCQTSPHTNLQCHACHIEVQIAKICLRENSLLMTSINKKPSENERPISCILTRKTVIYQRTLWYEYHKRNVLWISWLLSYELKRKFTIQWHHLLLNFILGHWCL